ncbi:MAG: hypothetical protein KOO60_08880 [Gemmatimonadales bacterium]|nr:hypothetical protein [Gemmatimonadales bacterium]
MIRILFITMTLFLASGFSIGVHAATPGLVNYQGMLKDSVGNYINGNHDLIFNIYPSNVPEATAMWTETHLAVSVDLGLFNVILGSTVVIPPHLFAGQERWLGITVDSESEMEPRMRMTSVPWAMRAAVADSALNAGGGDADNDWIVSGTNMYSAVAGSLGVGVEILRGKFCVETDEGKAISAGTHNGTAIYGYMGANRGSLGATEASVKGESDDMIGVLGLSPNVPVQGTHSTSGAFGQLGLSGYGVFGQNGYNENHGYFGSSDFGAYAENAFSGNYGTLGSATSGVHGYSQAGFGVYGQSDEANAIAVRGYAYNGTGVEGIHVSGSTTHGYLGRYDAGVYGLASNLPGVKGQSSTGPGIIGISTTGNAAEFSGDVVISNGRVITPVLEITGGSDLSEHFEIHPSTTGHSPEAGMLVCMDTKRPGHLVISEWPYDKKVAGVISGAGGVKPGLLMGQKNSVADGTNPVALTGRVYCWADATQSPIEPGDLLTTSAIPGHAMKAVDHGRSHGTIIGKAMTPLASGKGLVLVLVNLQ